MNYKVVVSIRAQSDLERNASWWPEHRDLNQAIRWYDGFVEEIESLAEHPQRCPLAPENHKVAHELRELHFGVSTHPTHRAIFTITDDEVIVLTMQHGAQDEVRVDELELE